MYRWKSYATEARDSIPNYHCIHRACFDRSNSTGHTAGKGVFIQVRTVRERICAYRERHGLSQAEMARQLGVSPQFLCDVEKGRKFISAELAAALAVLTGWDHEMLMKQDAHERFQKRVKRS